MIATTSNDVSSSFKMTALKHIIGKLFNMALLIVISSIICTISGTIFTFLTNGDKNIFLISSALSPFIFSGLFFCALIESVEKQEVSGLKAFLGTTTLIIIIFIATPILFNFVININTFLGINKIDNMLVKYKYYSGFFTCTLFAIVKKVFKRPSK